MRDFLIIKNLVGEDLRQEELKNVDCYVHEKFGLFIPSTGTCGYAQRKNHTHPSYMITILFSYNGIDNLLRVFRMKDGVATWWTMEKNFESKEYIEL